MLHVLLILLKILLWLIAGILGLVILLLLCVLFFPIRYRAKASYHGGKTAHVLARLHYLIFGARFLYDQETGTIQPELRILWFRIGKKSGHDKPEKYKKKNRKNKIKNTQEPEPKSTMDREKTIPIIGIPAENAVLQTGGRADTDSVFEPESAEKIFDLDDKPELPKEERRIFGRLKILLQTLRDRLKHTAEFVQEHTPDVMAEKIKPLKKKVRRLKKFWNLRCTEKTRAYLKTYIPGLFRHILPRKIKGRIHYGMEEPYKTGQITGYLSLLPFVYQKGLSVEPDFEQKIMEIDLKLAGHITLGYLLRIVLNINIWRTLKAAKKVMKNGGTN